jgi:hypothetical protein
MHALWSLFTGRKPRCFALLDATGVCRALRQSAEPPAASCWVEVTECRPIWLNQRLPSSARLEQAGSRRTSAA